MITYTCDACQQIEPAAFYKNNPSRRRRPWGWDNWSIEGKPVDACSTECAKHIRSEHEKSGSQSSKTLRREE